MAIAAGRSGPWRFLDVVIGAVRFWPQARLRPELPRPPRRAAGHPQGRNEVKDPRSGLTRRPTGWFGSANEIESAPRRQTDTQAGTEIR